MKESYKDKTIKELEKTLEDLREKIMRFNFDLAEKKLKDVSQISKTKKEIARILTELSKRTSV